MCCSPLWRPYPIKDIQLLERIQLRASKYILGDYTSDYKTHLIKLNLLSLMYIYELLDILFFVKSFIQVTNQQFQHISVCHDHIQQYTSTKSGGNKLVQIKSIGILSKPIHIFVEFLDSGMLCL